MTEDRLPRAELWAKAAAIRLPGSILRYAVASPNHLRRGQRGLDRKEFGLGRAHD